MKNHKQESQAMPINSVKTKPKNQPITFIDFCAGIGGGRLGLEKNGFKCLGFSEIDKQAEKTYRTFFGL